MACFKAPLNGAEMEQEVLLENTAPGALFLGLRNAIEATRNRSALWQLR
jgi:hypothetical protein